MTDLLRDPRVRRLLVANTLGSIGAGITIFAVPWLLVNQPDGNAAFRWTTIGTTVALFLIMPYWGAWVDRHSRKAALLGSELWGACATLVMAGVTWHTDGHVSWQLMAIYFAGMLYYTLHYPAKFALIQQLFAKSHYQSLVGLLEIQGQTAMMLAGGLGGLLITQLPLWAILLVNTGTYLASFAIQSTLPYAATHLATGRAADAPDAAAPRRPSSIWGSVAEGFAWLRARPRLALFFTCTLIPFVIVMTGNYLFPIYVAQTLQAGPRWFAAGEIAFAVGAIVAGFLLPRLIGRHSAANTIPATFLVFLAGLLVFVFIPSPLPFLAASLLLGFGNAGCRVARSALLLHTVPNEFMGRVGGFYNVLDRVLRTVLVYAMVIIDTHGPTAGYGVLTLILLLALVGVFQTRRALPTPAASAA